MFLQKKIFFIVRYNNRYELFFSMYKKNYKNYLSYIFLIVCITTTILSFIFKINLSNIFGEYILNEYLLNFDIKTKTGGAVVIYQLIGIILIF